MYKTKTTAIVISKSLTTGFTSGTYPTAGIDVAMFEVNWVGYSFSGTAGTLAIQSSGTGVVWGDVVIALPNTLTYSLTAGSDSQLFELIVTGGSFYRFIYTANNSTAGTITIAAVSKVVMDNGLAGG